MHEKYLKQHPDLQEKIRAAGREGLLRTYARVAAERKAEGLLKAPKAIGAKRIAKTSNAHAARHAQPKTTVSRREK